MVQAGVPVIDPLAAIDMRRRASSDPLRDSGWP